MTAISPFRRLLVATGLSSFGDGVRWIAMPLMATQLTDDPRLIAGVLIADRLPWLLFLLPGGALADRFDRLRMRVVLDGFRAVLGTAFVVLAATGHAGLSMIYAVTVLMASADAIVDSSSMALVPALVEPDELEHAAGHLQGTEIVTRDLLGPALGGVLFTFGLVVPLAVDAVSFAVSAAVAARDRAAEAQRVAMDAIGVSSQDEAERLERRVRVLSDRLEETEDRLDAALEQIRELRKELKGQKSEKTGSKDQA